MLKSGLVNKRNNKLKNNEPKQLWQKLDLDSKQNNEGSLMLSLSSFEGLKNQMREKQDKQRGTDAMIYTILTATQS